MIEYDETSPNSAVTIEWVSPGPRHTDGGRHPLVAELERLRAELAAATDKVKNLETALDNSREIGAAIGIVMNQRRLSADQAFAVLRDISQQTHRKLRDVASDVVYCGSLDPPTAR